MSLPKIPKPANQDTKIPVSKDRVLFVDYLRGFVVAIMVMDHAVQGYAQRFGNLWFFWDTTREPFFDALHMVSNAFIMPILFLLAGMFVLQSLERRGFFPFLKERFLRLIVPFLIFMPLLTIMAYPKYKMYYEPDISYPDFFIHFFTTRTLLQSGPYWFLGALMTLTLFALFLHYVLPFILSGFRAYVSWMTRNSLLGLLSIGLISGSLIGVSDLTWGAPWWIGWEKIFGNHWESNRILAMILKLNHVQASRFMLFIYYFFMGIAFAQGGHLKGEQVFLKKLAANWFPLLVTTTALGVIYIGYSLNWYDEGAYCHHSKGFQATLGYCDVNMILARTFMHGFFCILITATLMGIFYKYKNEPSDWWTSLSVNAFGIYLTHEVFTVLMQRYFYNSPAPVLFKFVAVWAVSFGVSWILVDKILRKTPGFRRIL
jgi:hypothetical protein